MPKSLFPLLQLLENHNNNNPIYFSTKSNIYSHLGKDNFVLHSKILDHNRRCMESWKGTYSYSTCDFLHRFAQINLLMLEIHIKAATPSHFFQGRSFLHDLCPCTLIPTCRLHPLWQLFEISNQICFDCIIRK